jgi:hypothetical protein
MTRRINFAPYVLPMGSIVPSVEKKRRDDQAAAGAAVSAST